MNLILNLHSCVGVCSSLVRIELHLLLLCPPQGSQAFLRFFPLNPKLLGISLYFFEFFVISNHPRNDEKGSQYKKFDLRHLRVQNKPYFAKTRYPALQPQLPSAMALSFCPFTILGWCYSANLCPKFLTCRNMPFLVPKTTPITIFHPYT